MSIILHIKIKNNNNKITYYTQLQNFMFLIVLSVLLIK